MSLLLDALKKSEAQRRRGRAPSVDLGAMPTRAESLPRRRWPWLVLALAFAAVVATGIWQWPTVERLLAPESDPTGTLAAGESGAADGPADATDAGSAAEPARPDAPAAERSAPNPAVTRAAAEANSAAAAQPQPSAEPADRAVAQSGSSPSARTETAGAPAADSAPPARTTPAQAPESDPPRISQQAGVESESRSDADEKPEAEATTAADRRSEAESALDGALRPWELPQRQRAEFPELDLTVHYFAVEPAERFVLINGERYRQGDRIEGGVRIREIVQRGVLLQFGSYLVLLE